MNVEDLLERARSERSILDLAPSSARGAEAYIQAYGYIAVGGQARTNWGRRRMAMRYLRLTASPPLTPRELQAANLAQVAIRHHS